LSKKIPLKNKTLKKRTDRSDSKSGGDFNSGPMDIALLERITVLMKEADLNTVDVRDGERRIVLKRGAPEMSGVVYGVPAQTSAPPPPSTSGAANGPQPAKPDTADADAGLVAIKSPMVGTFYTASSPEAKAFVSVGSTVDDETDVCVIEAMKVFNNIKAETKGTIAKILVTNGQTVEFGQPIFLVKP